MILLRQREFTSRATKELRKKILMKSGDIKKFKSEGYRTVERSKEEIEKDIAEALKTKLGRGQKPNFFAAGYRPSMPINEKITNKGDIKGQLYTGGVSRRKLDKDAREFYDHGDSQARLTTGFGHELRYWHY